MATLKFKVRNGIAPYVAKLKKVGIGTTSGYGYTYGVGYFGFTTSITIYDDPQTFTQQRVEVDGQEIVFNGVTSGAYILEVVDNTKFSTIEYINVP